MNEGFQTRGRSLQESLSQTRELVDTNEIALLQDVPLDQTWDEGIPTLHVFTKITDNTPADEPNTKLVIKVSWSSLKGGGRVTLDCPRGIATTFGACQKSVTVAAQYVPIDLVKPATLIIPGRTLVQCAIGGIGSLSATKPFCTSPRFLLPGAAPPTLPIPEMATRGKVLTNGVVAPSATALQIGTRDAFAAPIYQETGDKWLEVVAGGLFFRITNGGAATQLTAVWELSI